MSVVARRRSIVRYSAAEAALGAAQALPSISQSVTATVTAAGRLAVVNKPLGPLAQAISVSVPDRAAITKPLGSLGQTAPARVTDRAARAKALGALSQAAAASGSGAAFSSGFDGGFSGGAPSTASRIAARNTALGSIGQLSPSAALDRAAISKALGALAQSISARETDRAAVNQLLGAIQQAASIITPGTPRATVSQTLGALSQTIAAIDLDQATRTRALGALSQSLSAKDISRGLVSQLLGALGQSAIVTSADAGITAIRQVAGMPTLTSSALRSFGSFTTSVADVYEFYRQRWFDWDGDLAKGVPDSYTTTFVPLSSWGGQFYDRAFVDYQYYAMTGDATYKAHGDALVASIKSEFWNVGGFNHYFIYGWAHPRSMYIDYMLNGHADSWTAISKFADYLFTGSILNEFLTHTVANWDGRAFGRAFLCLRWAVHLGAPSLAGNNFASTLVSFRNALLDQWFDPQGAFYSSDQFKNKSYMSAIVCDALLDDSRLTVMDGGTPDSRILPAIGAILDYQNNNHWLARWGGLKYIDGLNEKDSFGGGPGPNVCPHLNMFIAGIAWRYSNLIGETSGSRPYAAFGDRLAIEAFNPNNFSTNLEPNTGSGPVSGKNFNELFTQCWPYLDTRISTGVAFPTTSRNMVSAWTPASYTLSGGGSNIHLFDSGALWNAKTRGRCMFLASKTAGTSGNFRIEVYSVTTSSVIAQRTFTATSTPTWLGYSDEVLVSGPNYGDFTIAINDGGDGLGSRTIRIDDMDLGIGASRYVFPAEPVMLELTGTGANWATDNTNSMTGCNARVLVGGVAYTPTSAAVGVGTLLTLNHGIYDTTQPAPASYIYKWRRDGKIITGASSQTYTTVSADSGHRVSGEELPVSAASVTGRPSQSVGVLVS